MPQKPMKVVPVAPQKKSSVWKFVLIGFGALLLIGIVALVGFYYFAADEIENLASDTASETSGATDDVANAMEIAKQGFMMQLSKRHTKKQIVLFEEIYDGVFKDERERLGMIGWGKNYGQVVQKLNMIVLDGKITVKESKAWCRMADDVLDENDYWEDND